MENYDLTVGGQPNVAFDPGAHLERGGKGKHAVFRQRSAVQAAVGEAGRPGIQGITP